MIQIVLGRLSADGKKNLFIQARSREGILSHDGTPIEANAPLMVPSLQAIFKNYNAIIDWLPPDERYNVFFTVAHHSGAGAENKPTRLITTFDHQTHLHLDIDHTDTQRSADYAAVIAEALQIPLSGMTLTLSGNGFQAFIGLKTPIRHAAYFDEQAEAYTELLRKIDMGLAEKGLPGQADPNIFDAARVMRLPGTENRKPDKPTKLSALIQRSDQLLDLNLEAVSGLSKKRKDYVDVLAIRRQYPKPDYAQIVKECHFLDYVISKPQDIKEPDFFMASTLLAQCDASATAETTFGQVTPHHLAELVFNHATGSVSLGKSTFTEKWDQAKKYGAPKCETVNAQWKTGCDGCPHWGKIPTPLALKSKTHVGSEGMGYWVLDPKGSPKHPAYQDLVKVYKTELPYIVTDDSRIMSFGGTHYKSTADITVKGWLEKTMQPPDPLRETQRLEFLSKIKADGAAGSVKSKDFFSETILGKLNCGNGVLDIRSGQMTPHSPDRGFLYVLPYELDLAASGSLFFLEWLGTITGDRPELIEAILDVMAYCLWPSYEDHVFTFLSGAGANGKSTLIRLIQEMVGRENYSTVSLQQLGSNRFMSALLEGKLANLSEESSGGDDNLSMSIEAMNIIKTLSAGEDTTAERKGRDGHTFRNTAKLIFSINKPPRFKESGHALRRRLLVIPFDHTISDPDSKVADRLVVEIPQIVSMLIRRIQENLKANQGSFRVNRGLAVTERAKETMLFSGNTIMEWASECFESAPEIGKDTYVTSEEAYIAYRQWCDSSGINHPANKISFGRLMCESVVTSVCAPEDRLKRINGKSARVYAYSRFKER